MPGKAVSSSAPPCSSSRSLRRELGALFFLVAIVMPVLTVGVVGGYGFAVWMGQQIYGPPGPAGH